VADQLIQLVQSKVRGFNARPLAFDDFLAACEREGIAVEIRPHLYDEELRRGSEPTIIVNAGLSEKYRTFVAFHSLAHWFAHPGHVHFYLGSPGWLSHVELEASTIGFLALAPHKNGPPYPRLTRAKNDGRQIEMFIEYPHAEPGKKIRWRRRRALLSRVDQTEFRWEEDSRT
jgi:hypothetical protein